MNYRSESLKIIQSVFELACGHPKAGEDANFERKKIEKQKCICFKKIDIIYKNKFIFRIF